MAIYDYQGHLINESSTPNNIGDNMIVVHGYDSEANTRYTIVRVFKQKIDGTYQHAFVRNYRTPDGASSNAIGIRQVEGWDLILNAGMGQGLVIENGTVITDTPSTHHTGAIPLTIDMNGDLSFVESDTTGKGQQYVNQGIVSAVCGFFPIVNNYNKYDYPTNIPNTLELTDWQRAQRQIIGQYGNGDYCIITGEGRNFMSSTGFSIAQEQDLCMRLGLRFAYNLDGGGSTQTLYGKKSVNTIYENGTGRKMPTYIVFNGTDTFSIPPA